MKAGDVVRWTFVQADGQRKMRPAIIVAQVPPYHDWLVCAVSTQLQRQVNGLDVLISSAHADFARTGLRTDSLVRVAQLATLPDNVIQGSIGDISPSTLALIKERLRKWLE